MASTKAPAARAVKVKKVDVRSWRAIERDTWLASSEGMTCLSDSILINANMVTYLRNRLESAFLAGMRVAERRMQQALD